MYLYFHFDFDLVGNSGGVVVVVVDCNMKRISLKRLVILFGCFGKLWFKRRKSKRNKQIEII